MLRIPTFWMALMVAMSPAPAFANEAFGGIYSPEVQTPLSMDSEESGASLQAGFRFAPLRALGTVGKPAPYVLASLNMKGGTSFAGIGLSWKVNVGAVYVRPEVGVIAHDGPSRKLAATGKHLELGSRVLFQPGISIGVEVDPRVSIEASWVHVSHGGLFNSKQNPGLDMLGMRVNLKL